jgi:MFS family permease
VAIDLTDHNSGNFEMALACSLSPALSGPASHGDPRAMLRRSLNIITWGWIFGAAWQAITTGTPLTVFAQALHASPFQFGVLTALPYLASLVSLPSSLLIDGTGKRKGVFLFGHYLQRLMWMPIALVPIWILQHYGTSAAGKAMFVFLALTLFMHCGQGLGSPAWVSWMADIVPGRICGKYFSRRRQWAMVTAIPAALIAGLSLDRMAGNSEIKQLHWCAILFICAAMLGLADITMFVFLGEKPRPRQAPVPLAKSFFRPLRDHKFMVFAIYVAVLTFSLTLTGQFANLYLLDVVGVNNTGVQLMLFVTPMVAQLLVLPLWGSAADRVGKKPLLAMSALGMAPVAVAWSFLSPTNAWFGYVLCGASAALWTGVEVANFNFVMEFAGGDRSAGGSYVAVNSVVTNLAGCMGGLVAGGIAQWLSPWHWKPVLGVRAMNFYDVLFTGSGLLRLLAVALILPFIHEPSARSVRGAMRFMAGQLMPRRSRATIISREAA